MAPEDRPGYDEEYRDEFFVESPRPRWWSPSFDASLDKAVETIACYLVIALAVLWLSAHLIMWSRVQFRIVRADPRYIEAQNDYRN